MEFTYGMFTGFSGRLAATPWNRPLLSLAMNRMQFEAGDNYDDFLPNLPTVHAPRQFLAPQSAAASPPRKAYISSDLNKPRFTKKFCASYNVLRRNGLELKSTLVRSDKVSGCNPAR